jgi:hypothetical protein
MNPLLDSGIWQCRFCLPLPCLTAPSLAGRQLPWKLTHILDSVHRCNWLELLYNWRFTANQFVLVTIPWRLTTSNFIFQLNTCGYSPYVTSSLMRGWVCHLQLLLVHASAVILGSESHRTHDHGSESHRTHDHLLLSQIQDSPNLVGHVPVFISPRNRVARLYPQALGSLFVASYDSQGCSGDIRPCLHVGAD